MRVLDGVAQREEQPDTRLEVEPVLLAIPIHREPVHVLDDDVRHTLRRRASVEEAGDVRMFESREDPPLVAEAGHRLPVEEGAGEHLHGHGLLEVVALAHGLVDDPHPAAPDLLHRLVRAEALPQRRRLDLRHDAVGHALDHAHALRHVGVGRGEEALHLAAESLVALAGLRQEGGPLGSGPPRGLVEEGIHPGPAIRVERLGHLPSRRGVIVKRHQGHPVYSRSTMISATLVANSATVNASMLPAS